MSIYEYDEEEHNVRLREELARLQGILEGREG